MGTRQAPLTPDRGDAAHPSIAASTRSGPIRIAQLIPTIHEGAGGTSTALLSTLAAMRERPRELDFTVFTSRMPEGDLAWSAVEADGGENGTRWRLSGPFARGLLPGDLARVFNRGIAERRFDLLHIHGVWSSDLLACARAAARCGVPYLWQPHGMLVRRAYRLKPLKKQAFMAAGLRSAIRKSAGLLFVTEDERDTSVIPSGVPRDRLHVVPLPVEFPPDLPDRETLRRRGRERFGLADDADVVVFLGRLHPVKRLELAFDALALLAKSRPLARLLLLGSGDDDYVASLRARAQAAGVAQRVVFGGWVTGPGKWDGLAAGDVLSLHSMFENFGYVLIEALGVGTPVVLTENLALANEVRAARRSEGGLGSAATIVPQTAEALASGYSRALAREDAGAGLVNAHEWSRGSFSPQRIAERLQGVYARVLGRE